MLVMLERVQAGSAEPELELGPVQEAQSVVVKQPVGWVVVPGPEQVH